MHLVSVFQHSINLESAIIDLEQVGISGQKILALPLQKSRATPTYVQSSQAQSSHVDLIFICGMIGMLLGAIYGFILTWGPIIWALVGMVVGAVVGLLVELTVSGSKMLQRSTIVDVVLIVDCSDVPTEMVETILWSHQALGVAKQPVLASH